ncbi:hypothetical protein MIDIC_60013 [Alphaproteobacteria bacterium]
MYAINMSKNSQITNTTNILNNSTMDTASVISTSLSWTWARVPNFKEVLTSSTPTAIVTVLAEGWLNKFGYNPVAKAFIRDFLKVPSNVASVLFENELGGTGVKYDIGNVYGGLTKAFCKASVISVGQYTAHGATNKEYLAAWGRGANYACEPLVRLFALTSKDKQKLHDTETGYFTFMRENMNFKLAGRAVVEGIAKNAVADNVGEVLNKYHVPQNIKGAYVKAEGKFISAIVGQGVQLTLETTMLTKFGTINHGVRGPVLKVVAVAALVAIDIVAKIGAEIITTYLLAPFVRIGQDGVGAAVDWLMPKSHVTEPKLHQYYGTDYHNNTTLGHDNGSILPSHDNNATDHHDL